MGLIQVRIFEDSEAWKIRRELTKTVYFLTEKDLFSPDFGLLDQIHRSATSLITDTAEGFEGGSNKDFVKLLFSAKGSADEVRSLLYVALDKNDIDQEDFNPNRDPCIQNSKMIWGLIKSLHNK